MFSWGSTIATSPTQTANKPVPTSRNNSTRAAAGRWRVELSQTSPTAANDTQALKMPAREREKTIPADRSSVEKRKKMSAAAPSPLKKLLMSPCGCGAFLLRRSNPESAEANDKGKIISSSPAKWLGLM